MEDKKLVAKKPLHEQPVSPATLLPIHVIQLYDDTAWEEFVLEWLDGAQPKYPRFDRVGGAGDKGRDIVAYTTEQGPGPLDVFQCKHYDRPLMPGNAWLELGKLCVYTWKNVYPVPRKYRFVAPRGVGTTLHDLLNDPEKLRAELIATWDQHCREGISSKEKFTLDGALLAHVKAFDFKIVGYEPPHAVLEQHRRTRHWHLRFKRDLPKRPAAGAPPAQPEQRELPYVTELLGAYGEHLGQEVPAVDNLDAHGDLKGHFSRARIDFFNADGLNRFYRDQFSEGAFDDVKKQIYDGVVDTATRDHADGYQRVLATAEQSVQVQLAQNDYTTYVEPSDKKGICHHLVNDDKLKWVHRHP